MHPEGVSYPIIKQQNQNINKSCELSQQPQYHSSTVQQYHFAGSPECGRFGALQQLKAYNSSGPGSRCRETQPRRNSDPKALVPLLSTSQAAGSCSFAAEAWGCRAHGSPFVILDRNFVRHVLCYAAFNWPIKTTSLLCLTALSMNTVIL